MRDNIANLLYHWGGELEAWLDEKSEEYVGQQMPDSTREYHMGRYADALHRLVLEKMEETE